jgi:hypothetical protein
LLAFGAALSKIRKRRWFLWGVILIYMPAMWVTLRVTNSLGRTMPVFVVWFILLVIAVTLSAIARCPQCGNYYHMNGMTLLYFRRCLHCELHINSDKKTTKV